MTKRLGSGGKPVRLKKVLSDSEIDNLLDDLDEALSIADGKQVEALLDHLPEESSQIPEIITRRIIDGRFRIPIFALEMLGMYAGDQTPEYMKRIAEDRSVEDLSRFNAQRFLGWPDQGGKKRRREFLETMKDAGATLVQAVEQADATWPAGIDIMEEALSYLEAVPGAERQALISRVARELGASAAWLLTGAIHIPHEKTQLATLAELVKLRPAWAGVEIERLARTARTAKVRLAAADASHRLSLDFIARAVDKKQTLTLPPVERVVMSAIDGKGGQAIVVVRQWEQGAFMFAYFIHDDYWGIRNVFGSGRAIPEQVDDIMAGLEEEGIGLLEVDLAEARGAIAQAIEIAAETGNTLPPSFALWEPLLHEEYPPRSGETKTLPELDDAPYAGRNDLLRSSGRLADHPYFESWTFDYFATSMAMDGVPPPSGGRLTDRQYKPLIEQLVNAKIAGIFRGRLRRQAWLLDRAGDKKERDLALAIAAQLATANLAELVKQPFLRAVVERSVDLVIMSTPDITQ